MKVLLCSKKVEYIGGAEIYLDKLKALLVSNNIITSVFYFEDLDNHNFDSFFNELNKFNPNILHFNKDVFFSKKQCQLIKKLDIPVVLTVHDYFCIPFPTTFRNKLKNLIKKRYRPFDYYVIPSKNYYDKLIKNSIDNVVYIPHFIDLDKWSNMEKKSKLKKILFVGRLEKEKGIFLLINVFNKLSIKNKNIVLYIVGSGSCVSRLQNKINKLNLCKKIKLVGFKTRLELAEYYSEATLLVIPTLKHELFGLVGLEAKASKLPVIASNLDGIKEWCINEYTGITFNSKDANDLMRKIRWLLTDQKMYDYLKNNAYNFVSSNYSKEITYKKLYNFYKKISNEL